MGRLPNLSHPLVQARLDLSLTQAQLAKKLGIRPETVQSWETGKTKPPAFLWLAIELILLRRDGSVSESLRYHSP